MANTWEPQVARIFASYGVPVYVWRPIMLAESSGNPNAVGDAGTSFGLFQLHYGGQGTGYSRAQLLNPVSNAQIAAPYIARAYHSVKNLNVPPLQQAGEVAIRSGHPGGAPNVPLLSAQGQAARARINLLAQEEVVTMSEPTPYGASGVVGKHVPTSVPYISIPYLPPTTLPPVLGNPLNGIADFAGNVAQQATSAIPNPLAPINAIATSLSKRISQFDFVGLGITGLGLLVLLFVFLGIMFEHREQVVEIGKAAAGAAAVSAA